MAKSTAPTTLRTVTQDRAAQFTIGPAILLNILLFILVLLSHDRLVETMTASNNAGQFSSPSSAFVLPIIGAVAWLLTSALGYYYYGIRDEAPVATIVWGTAIVIQLATWVPIMSLIINP